MASLAGLYVVQAVAGRGGMGIVFRGRDTRTGDRVAIKTLHHAASSPALFARFQREVGLIAAQRHEGIVRYIAHGHAAAPDPSMVDGPVLLAPGDDMMLVLEWLEGESLQERLRRQPMDLPDALDVTRNIAVALRGAHDLGIVHRDIKPSNIWLVNEDLRRIKILDFGISRRSDFDKSITRVGTVLGTPGYMAPEQARNDPKLDGRADVYSLGAVLFRILVGRSPRRGNDAMAQLFNLVAEDAPRLRDLRPDLPEDVDDLVAKLLSRDPAERPQDVNAVALAIGRVSRTSGVPAPGSMSRSSRRMTSVVVLKLVPGRPLTAGIAAHIESFGGRFQLVGDGAVLAIFRLGAAADLAARASRCALFLAREIAPSSLVVATGWSEETRAPSASAPSLPGATADVMDRAVALLREVVAPSAIVLDEVTIGLLGDGFATTTYQRQTFLVGERDRHAPPAHRFVGREAEMQLLRSIVDAVIVDRHPKVALIVGPPGSGKSRLVHEIVSKLGDLEVWTATSDSLRAGQPLAMVSNMLERVFDLRIGESPERHYACVAARVAEWISKPERAARVTHALVALYNIDESTHGERSSGGGDRSLSAFIDFIDAKTREKRPLVIVLDDLQWGDARSIRYVEYGLNALPRRPIVVVGVARPEVKAAFPDLFVSHDPVVVELAGLSKGASEELVHAMLPGLAPERTNAIVDRAAGNAFWLEELVRAEAAGITELPATIVAMADARLEALPADAKRVLRAASVFGQSFWESAVVALLRDDVLRARRILHDLVHREILKPRGASRFEAEREYGFRQALLRDAAYTALTETDRALGHRLAAGWLEARGEPQARVIAEHHDRAGDLDKAAIAYARAAEQALETNDFSATMACAARSLECGLAEPFLGHLHLLRADAARWTSDHALSERDAKLAMGSLPSGSASWAMAAALRASAASRIGHHADVREAARLLTAAFNGGARGSRVRAWLASAGVSLAVIGDRGGANHIRACLEMGSSDAVDPFAVAFRERLIAYLALLDGDPFAYLRHTESATRLFEEAGDIRFGMSLGASLGFAHLSLGCIPEAEQILREVIERAERLDMRGIVALAKHNLGMALAWSGRLEEGKRLEEEAIAESVAQRDFRIEAGARAYLARMHLMAGDLDAAEREAERGLAIAPASVRPYLGAIRGQLHLSRREAKAALQEIERLREDTIASEEGQVLVALVHAGALDRIGRRDEAAAVVQEAYARLTLRSERIPDPVLRRKFLSVIPEHAKLIELATS